MEEFRKAVVNLQIQKNRMRIKIIVALLLVPFVSIYAQKTGSVSGTIINKSAQQPIANVNISLANKQIISDSVGKFRISQVPTGTYTLRVSAVGYTDVVLFNILVSSGNENNLSIEMEPSINELKAVTVTSGSRKTAKAATLETPLSVQRLTTEEITRNPGGNFDISRVIQSLPGVGGTASTAGFRNDIIIRGGAPNENVYYLDGIEIPVINHFATQGSAGGPAGILNVSFIEDVKLSTSAFDARFDNALSSVFEFKQKKVLE